VKDSGRHTPAARQVDRADGDDPMHQAPAAEQIHSLSFDLPLDSGRDATGGPTEREPPVVADVAHDVAYGRSPGGRLPSARARRRARGRRCLPDPRSARKQPHERVDHPLLMAGRRRHRGEAGEIGSAASATGRSRPAAAITTSNDKASAADTARVAGCSRGGSGVSGPRQRSRRCRGRGPSGAAPHPSGDSLTTSRSRSAPR
jgi:hypothetical protein